MTTQPTQRNLPFDISYSFHLEEMTSLFHLHCNQICTLFQWLLGAFIFAGNLHWLLGLMIVLIASLQFSAGFNEKAGNAKVQASRYRLLLDDMPNLSEDDIIKQLQAIEKSDSQVLSSLCNPARKRTSIALHGYDLESNVPLNRLEKISTIIGGGIPK
ncbi:hypothetical protein PXH59_12540 [Xenorhabdus sp. SF857]|uniref:hypothetical protein n=1 Tax=Xenorhabdus bakwenae TaxID=3026967 RepID=UPI00255822A0|nr:hypothetical protein [Xenorhabdus sp. SF857]WFQ78544.1 hypothetical protein PXH59_12540 [Xenorhabdus sp. SF857]